jgi:hypothetical protein
VDLAVDGFIIHPSWQTLFPPLPTRTVDCSEVNNAKLKSKTHLSYILAAFSLKVWKSANKSINKYVFLKNFIQGIKIADDVSSIEKVAKKSTKKHYAFLHTLIDIKNTQFLGLIITFYQLWG